MFDPDARTKAFFRTTLMAAMEELDIVPMPFLGVTTGLYVNMKFVLPRPRNDFTRHGLRYFLREVFSRIPVAKDIDNMLKYFMDALQGVLYANDNCIVAATIVKCYPEDNLYHKDGWADISVSSIQ